MSHRPIKNFFQETHHPLLKSSELNWISSGDLLSKIAARSETSLNAQKPKAIIFDLDSTLFCTATRLKSILIRYIASHSTDHAAMDPAWIKLAHQLESIHQNYSVPATLFQMMKRFHPEDQAKSLVKEFWPGFEEYWKEEFFLSRNMTVDPPYEGSVEFVKKTVEMGYSPIYLTGRDYGRGMDGTKHALRRWDYPLGSHSHTILKPDRAMKDMDFKQGVAQVLNSRFDVHFVIDNEPENLAMFAVKIPSSEIVFFHSIMSHRWSAPDLKADLSGRKILGLKSFAD